MTREEKNNLNLDTITKPKKSEEKIEGKKVVKKEKEIKKDLDLRAPKEKNASYRKVVIYFSILLSTLGIFFLITPLVYGYIYRGRVLPGVYVLGEDASGMSEGEIKKVVREKLENNKFVFINGDKEETAEFSEMGLGIDFIRLSKRALERGREGELFEDYSVRYKSIVYYLSPKNSEKYFTKLGVKLDYGVDQEKLNKFAKAMSESMSSGDQNAGIVIKGSDIIVIPARYGEKVIADSLGEQITRSIDRLRVGEKMVLGVTAEKIEGNIIDANLKKAVLEAKAIISTDLTLKYGDKIFTPAREELASWIIFEGDQHTLKPRVDRVKVEKYFAEISKEINVVAHPKRLRVENGTKEIVEEEGAKGLEVDVKGNADILIGKLEGKEEATIDVATKVVEAPVQTKKVLVADWAKYIEIDLASQRMVAYENKEPVFSDAITSGKKGFSTPTGTFMIYNKTRSQTMKGFLGTPEAYYLPNVQYISWFNGAIAVHQAYWRKSFGGKDYDWNGSHGCINATLSSAKWIYDWAPIGTPVVVHN